jgi:hypothetical protein
VIIGEVGQKLGARVEFDDGGDSRRCGRPVDRVQASTDGLSADGPLDPGIRWILWLLYPLDYLSVCGESQCE